MSENTATVTVKQPPDLSEPQGEETVETSKFLIFVTDTLKLGIDSSYVVEIIHNHQITYLPMMPSFVRGIINLRGQIIPILDIRMRMGKEPREECLVVVLNIEGGQVGILVDAVDQMIDIPKDSILPVPNKDAQQLVSGMCSIPGSDGTMLVLDCDQLLRHE
jgi:purine-binding chemotaxis protein CheW